MLSQAVVTMFNLIIEVVRTVLNLITIPQEEILIRLPEKEVIRSGINFMIIAFRNICDTFII